MKLMIINYLAKYLLINIPRHRSRERDLSN
jgi:hypothetical protein